MPLTPFDHTIPKDNMRATFRSFQHVHTTSTALTTSYSIEDKYDPRDPLFRPLAILSESYGSTTTTTTMSEAHHYPLAEDDDVHDVQQHMRHSAPNQECRVENAKCTKSAPQATRVDADPAQVQIPTSGRLRNGIPRAPGATQSFEHHERTNNTPAKASWDTEHFTNSSTTPPEVASSRHSHYPSAIGTTSQNAVKIKEPVYNHLLSGHPRHFPSSTTGLQPICMHDAGMKFEDEDNSEDPDDRLELLVTRIHSADPSSSTTSGFSVGPGAATVDEYDSAEAEVDGQDEEEGTVVCEDDDEDYEGTTVCGSGNEGD